MSRYKKTFEQLKQKNEGAFVPFVMIGDPNLDESFNIICTLIESGADALELGIPFSDPIADGPTIQRSALRALQSGTTPAGCLEVIRKLRCQYFDIPIGLLLYSNLVLRQGIQAFYCAAVEAGVDSILLADVPLKECEPFREQAMLCQLDQILIAPPNANDETLKAIAQKCDGYVYVQGRSGVTGAEASANVVLSKILEPLKRYNSVPALVGFGISTPEQVSYYVNNGVAGVICGSAVVSKVEAIINDVSQAKESLQVFCQEMKGATRKSET